ncbi:hypothetical protein ABT001_29065 [Streptomyces sp. NPDC002793]|uniref:DUF7691 family protein n=1 Tax=Streptomyces sp. NPDC002793 TaxID=3154432 RepID=UPI003319A3BE
MSSSLSVYLLDVARTRALIGSGDDQLLEVMRAEFGDDMARDDDYHRSSIETGAPTSDEALRAVIHGGPFDDDQNHAFQYGYAYKRLCSLTGRFLPNDCFTPHRGDWLSVVDQGLAAVGITAVSVDAFSDGPLPAPLPYTGYTPGCDEWTPDRIAQALRQFGDARRAAEESGQTPQPEPHVKEAVEQCLDWMRYAVARPGHGVIGFRS